MSVTTNQLARIAALLCCGFSLSSCVLPPPLPPPDVWYENGERPNQPSSATDNQPADPGNPTPSNGPRPEEYPVAKPTKNPDQVISPYEPYNVIDVSGFHSGQLARDPSNRKIFRLP